MRLAAASIMIDIWTHSKYEAISRQLRTFPASELRRLNTRNNNEPKSRDGMTIKVHLINSRMTSFTCKELYSQIDHRSVRGEFGTDKNLINFNSYLYKNKKIRSQKRKCVVVNEVYNATRRRLHQVI